MYMMPAATNNDTTSEYSVAGIVAYLLLDSLQKCFESDIPANEYRRREREGGLSAIR